MPRFEIVSKGDLIKDHYSLIFYLGLGHYQCFPSWRDFLKRNKKVDKSIDIAFKQNPNEISR